MLQDQHRWTAALLFAAVILATAAVLIGGGILAAGEAQAATTYTVQSGDSLQRIAGEFGVSMEDLAAANDLQAGAFLRRGQVLVIPAADEAAAVATEEATAQPPAEPATVAEEPAMAPAASTYTVSAGDSLQAIAGTFGVTVEALAEANNLRPGSFLRRGQVLTIPSSDQVAEAPGEPVVEIDEPASPPASTYTVVAGDSLQAIAKTFGVSVEALAQANGLSPSSFLRRGQVLIIPSAEAMSDAALSPAEATAAPTEEPAATEEAAEAMEPEATDEAMEEPAAEAAPMPTEEPAAEEPGAESGADPEATEEPAAEATAVPTEEPVAEEPDAGSGAEPEATGEPTEEPAAEATPVPTEEPVAEEPGAEPAAEPAEAAAAEDATAAGASSAVVLPMVSADQDSVAAANAWQAPDGGPEIFSPVANGAYHSPIAISGLAQPGAEEMSVTLTGSDGTVLAERTLAIGDVAAFFRTYVRFEVTEPAEAVLSVGGQDVPITLVPGQRFIDVNSPAVGAIVCGTVAIDGYSNTFEANVVLALSSPEGEPLEELPTMGGAYGLYRDFSATFGYTSDETVGLLVSAHEVDASGLYDTLDQTVVPVTYYPAGSAVCE